MLLRCGSLDKSRAKGGAAGTEQGYHLLAVCMHPLSRLYGSTLELIALGCAPNKLPCIDTQRKIVEYHKFLVTMWKRSTSLYGDSKDILAGLGGSGFDRFVSAIMPC